MSKLEYISELGLRSFFKQLHKVKPIITYEVIIDSTNSDPEMAVTYTEDISTAAGWDNWKDMPIFRDLRPCIIKEETGKVQYYLRRNDYTARVPSGKGYDSEDRLDSDLEANLDGTDGEVFVEIPFCGYKLNYEGDNLHVSLTNAKNQEGYCYYAHSLDDVGDCDYIYIGAYLLSVKNNYLTTVSGETPRRSMSLTDFRMYVQSEGTGYQLLSWYIWNLIQVLYLIVFKNLDSQTAVGRGYENGTIAITGQTDSTGFCSSSGDPTDGKHQVKCLGIEDFWGNTRQWCDGIYIDESRNILTDYKNFHDTGEGYQFSEYSNYSRSVMGFFSKAAGTNQRGFLSAGEEFADNGSESTYFCDYDITGGQYYNAYVGGGTSLSNGYAGVFCVNMGYPASVVVSTVGARAVYKHQAF